MRRIALLSLMAALWLPATLAAGERSLPSTDSVRQQIQLEIPEARFESESRIRLGRFALAFLKPVARWALDDDDEARILLRGIQRVEISTYRVVSMPETETLVNLSGLEDLLAERGWHTIVRNREPAEQTWVFSRHREDGRMSGIFVIELDAYELSLVGIAGRIDEILAAAIAEEPGDLADLFGS
jgi:hypothetical protein